MNTHRFIAENHRAALRKVRASLGDEAIIISTRAVAGGTEVIAASERDMPVGVPLEKSDVPFGDYMDRELQADAPTAADDKPVGPDLLAARESFLARQAETVAQPALRSESPRAALWQAPAGEVPASAPAVSVNQGPALGVEELEGLGFSRETAQQLLGDQAHAQGFSLRMALASGLRRHLSTFSAPTPSIMALLGPTGVGKTTTIAKLAAHYVQQFGSRQVALLTTDTYRISGTDQLRTYGRLLGVEVEVVSDPAAMRARLAAHQGKRLVLIDTAGFSPRDERLFLQAGLLDTGMMGVARVLVLNAASHRKHLQYMLSAYQPLGVQACILSKVDESASLGDPLDLLVTSRLPLLFFTDGQRVPEDLRQPDPESLASWVWQAGQFQWKEKTA